MGCEQHTHSDAIHITTFPPGGFLGVWVPLDDTDNGKAPLHYFPRSHRLAYFLHADDTTKVLHG